MWSTLHLGFTVRESELGHVAEPYKITELSFVHTGTSGTRGDGWSGSWSRR